MDIRIVEGLRVLVEGANLTNRPYAYDEGFPEAGRTYGATLTYRW